MKSQYKRPEITIFIAAVVFAEAVIFIEAEFIIYRARVAEQIEYFPEQKEFMSFFHFSTCNAGKRAAFAALGTASNSIKKQ